MKKIIIIIILFFLSSCGYSPIYKNSKSSDLMIIITDLKGNKEMNNLIKNQLELYSNKNSNNKFYININTFIDKIIISRTTGGAASDYQLYLKTNFEINHNKKTQKIVFEERFNFKNISDSFEQRNYENTIKNNFASSLRKKLILKLISIK